MADNIIYGENMDSGAKAAISGFRKQALYTLDLVLRDSKQARHFQPEGEEDLAIYESDSLERVVQVKAYGDPLTLSILGRPFFHRVASLEENVTIEVASFGEFGPELDGCRRGEQAHVNSVRKKLVDNYDLTDMQSASVISRMQFRLIDEREVTDRVFKSLGSSITAGDPNRAFELLTWWVFQAAESKQKITFSEMRNRLQSIGRYFAERAAQHDEWFTTIKPLEESEDTAGRREELAQQYYRGAAARYTHICAGLDVRRETLLAQIEKSFNAGRQVVILHGASGQGKTSLALRYLHNYVPDEWRLMVTAIDDRRHAAAVANALADHLQVVNAPVYLLIDVAPTDLEWVALVRELLDKPNVRILVAIREEDLARRRASNPELGFPADISLDFTSEEAEVIYEHIERSGEAQNAFPTFVEAWERFGERGPLLEFVYLITQTESLRDVLADQVERLRDEINAKQIPAEALRFLHICALATSFEARIRLRPLAEYLRLADPLGILHRFEKEYMLRTSSDQKKVAALHPVRSTILAEILDDPAFAPKEEVALESLPLVPESDLQIFLLYVLSRLPGSWDAIRIALSNLEVTTWTGAAGIARALIWWGIRCYQEENRALLAEAEHLANEAWIYFVFPDITGAGESDPGAALLDVLRDANPALIAATEELRQRLPPTRVIFEPFSDWISTSRITEVPHDESDWAGLAELLLWTGKFNLSPPGPVNIADIPVDTLPLGLLSDLSVALYESLPEQHAEFIEMYDSRLRERFRRETHSLVLEESSEDLFAHFIVAQEGEQEAELGEGDESGRRVLQRPAGHEVADDSSNDLSARLNEEAVDRASLLRSLYPQKARFCTRGYGHQIANLIGGFDLPFDASHKTLARSALPLFSLVETNSIFRALDEYHRRPRSWREFADQLLDVREVVATTLLRLHRSLVTYFKRSQTYNVIGGRLTAEMWDRAREVSRVPTYLPASAVDEWGLSSDTKGKVAGNISRRSISVASSFVFRRHRSFRKAFRLYMSSASNFFNQAGVVCLCHSRWGRQVERRAESETLFAAHGYGEDRLRLSKHNLFELMGCIAPMQEEFDARLGGLVDSRRLDKVKRRECQLFPGLWALWYQFCHHPERRLRNAESRALSAFERAADDLRRQLAARLAESEDWSASILGESFQWKERKALALQVEVGALLGLESARTGVMGVLGEVLGGPEVGSLKHYARDYRWPHVLVIPTFKGFVLEKGCWAIPASVFYDSSGGVDQPWLRPLQPLSDEQLQELGLDIFETEYSAQIKRLYERFAEATGIFGHIGNFVDLIPQLDEVGEEILQEYLQGPMEKLREYLVEIHELSPGVISRARELSGGNEELQTALVDPLEEIFRILDDNDGKKIQILLQEANEKATWFGELAGHANTLRWLEVPGSLEEFIESVTDADAGQMDS